MTSRLEIWSKEKWAACDEAISADEIAENMSMLGIQLVQVYIKTKEACNIPKTLKIPKIYHQRIIKYPKEKYHDKHKNFC